MWRALWTIGAIASTLLAGSQSNLDEVIRGTLRIDRLDRLQSSES
jgi:hypothetical protein